ncbi:MAG: hypothetical protein KC561_00585, partial [Myxococcales bacterium]|nr:hypothetical protein [Myxococcales bacterium]
MICSCLGNVARAQAPISHEYFDIYSDSAPGHEGSGLEGFEEVRTEQSESPPLYSEDGAVTGEFGSTVGNNAPPNPGDTLSLDRDTDMEGWLDYFQTYQPSIVPFKRTGARDQVLVVNGQVLLSIRDESLERVRVRAVPEANSRTFRGHMRVALRSGVYMPIPSVSPEMAIHGYLSDPDIPLTFFKDSADNYFVRSEFDGEVDMELSVSAPERYFVDPTDLGLGGNIPRDLRPEPLPPEVTEPAQRLFEQL